MEPIFNKGDEVMIIGTGTSVDGLIFDIKAVLTDDSHKIKEPHYMLELVDDGKVYARAIPESRLEPVVDLDMVEGFEFDKNSPFNARLDNIFKGKYND